MANYLVTRHKTVLGTAAEVAELMETYIETIDNDNTRYVILTGLEGEQTLTVQDS